jgi:ubiquinone/menaquinone biosynthesis C-methylase UbiE
MYNKNLSSIYDVIYHFKDYGKDGKYILEAIDRFHPSAKTLLESACGTGLFLEVLKDHFNVQGLDLSPHMLHKARERLPNIPLHLADMTRFSLKDKFDVVCCLFRSIAFVKTADKMFNAVKSMAAHLQPGGILIIEPFFTPETFWNNTLTLNKFENDSLKISWMYTSKSQGEYAQLDNHFLIGTPEEITHFVEVHEMGLFSFEDYKQAFAEADLGFYHDPEGPSGTGLYIGKKS